MAILKVDLSQTKEQPSFDPVPPGDYLVQITDSSVVTTRKGDPMLKIIATICDGKAFNGRKIFDNFLIGHPVAMSRLKALAIAANHPHPDFINDSEELHGLRMIIRVKIKTEDGYPPQNKITSFKKFEGAGSQVAPGLPPVSPVFAPAPPATPVFSFTQPVAPASVPILPATAVPAPTVNPPPFSFAAQAGVLAQASVPTPAQSSPAMPQPAPAPVVALTPAPEKLPWD